VTKTKLELGAGVLVTIVCLLSIWEAFQYRGESGLMPQAVTTIATLLALVWVVQTVLSLQREEGTAIKFNIPVALRFTALVGGTVLVVLGITSIGFFTSAAIAVPVISVILGYRRPGGIALATVIFVAVLFGVFHLLLRIPLPPEALLGWIG
jgi:putative tricarboxylic transport membrane protein